MQRRYEKSGVHNQVKNSFFFSNLRMKKELKTEIFTHFEESGISQYLPTIPTSMTKIRSSSTRFTYLTTFLPSFSMSTCILALTAISCQSKVFVGLIIENRLHTDVYDADRMGCGRTHQEWPGERQRQR